MILVLFALLIPWTLCAVPGAGQPPEKKSPTVAKDIHGETLPAGTVARFGCLRMRLDGGLADVVFTPDNRAIAVAGSVISKIENNTRHLQNVVRLWDPASGKTLKDFEKVEQTINQIAYSADGKILAGMENNSSVRFWDAASGKKLPQEFRLGGLIHFALAPDGNLVAVSEADGQVCRIILWDRARNKRLAVLDGHQSTVNSLAFSADGKQLTSASRHVRYYQQGKEKEKPKEIILQGQVNLWDVAKGSKIREIVHDSNSVVVSGDGALAAWVPQEGKKIVVIDVRNKGKQITIPGERHSFLFSPDNKTLVTGNHNYRGRFQQTEGGDVIFWDLATGKETHRLEGHVGKTSRVLRFSADGKLLATGSWDGGYWSGSNWIRIWDVKTGRELHPLPAHSDRIACVVCSPDGRIMASGSNDKTIRLWQTATGKPLHLLAAHDGDIKTLAFSPDSKTLASAASDKSVRLWDSATGKERALHTDLTAPVLALAFTPDGKTLRAALSDGSVISWQGKKSTIINLLDKGISLRFAALPPDARTMLAQLSQGDRFFEQSSNTLPLWQLPFGKPLGHVQIPDKNKQDAPFSGTQCWAAAFSADARFLATSESQQSHGLRGVYYFDNTLRIWEAASDREVLKITGLPSPSQSLVFSADGRFLASNHGDIYFWGSDGRGTTMVWDTGDGRKLADLQVQTGAVTCAAFVPHGKTLVAGQSDYTLLAWDLSPLARISDLPKKLAAADLKKAWEDLAGNDAPLAYQTIGRLVAAEKDSIAFLAKHLRPAPPVDYKRIDPLIADLNSDQFSVRQKASRELENMGEVTEAALRKALLKKGSLEYRRRIESLLQKLNQPPSGAQLRIIRVLTVLERMGTRASRDLLQSLAAGAPEVRLTQQARATLDRITDKWN